LGFQLFFCGGHPTNHHWTGARANLFLKIANAAEEGTQRAYRKRPGCDNWRTVMEQRSNRFRLPKRFRLSVSRNAVEKSTRGAQGPLSKMSGGVFTPFSFLIAMTFPFELLSARASGF